MAVFGYTARTSDGRVVTGDQEATSEFEALKLLQGQGLLVTRIHESAHAAAAAVVAGRRLHQRIRSHDLLLFIRQLSTLLTSNVPLLRSLEVIRVQTQSKQLAAVIGRIETDIRAGATLKDAMGRHPRLFPPLWAFLVEAGEISGKLPLILEQLASHYETTQRIKRKFVTAMVYPILLSVVAVGAVSVFMLWIIPIFDRLFKSFNAPLPLLTQAVIALSTFMRAYIFWLVAAGVGAGVFVSRAAASPSGRSALDRILLRMPILGAFLQDVILARTAASLHILIKSGVNILRGLDIAARSSGNRVFEEALIHVRDDVQHGKTIGASMAKHAIFPGMLVQMVMIGEESGRLEELVGRVQVYYEEQVDVFVNRLGTLLEPLILGFMGCVIGLLVISMFLPILRLSTIVR